MKTMKKSTIPDSQMKADFEILDSCRCRFRDRAIAARKRGDRDDARELDALALLFERVANICNQARASGAGVAYRTSDYLDIGNRKDAR